MGRFMPLRRAGGFVVDVVPPKVFPLFMNRIVWQGKHLRHVGRHRPMMLLLLTQLRKAFLTVFQQLIHFFL